VELVLAETGEGLRKPEVGSELNCERFNSDGASAKIPLKGRET
jgi:hypothetical protein